MANLAIRTLLGVLCAAALIHAATLYNNVPRRDQQGNILQVADGSILWWQELFVTEFYLYGSVYQPCPVAQQNTCYMPCGWYNTTFGIYVSTDMVTWSLVTLNALPQMTDPSSPYNSTTINSYFEPAVLFNQKTGKLVMWFQLALNALNFSPHLSLPRGVAVADSPNGPFEIVNFTVPGFGNGSSVFFWIEDSTQNAYMVFNDFSRPNQNLAVALLTDDYLGVAKVGPYFGASVGLEGGGIFERNGTWYVMSGTGCCFCPSGGSVMVFTSSDPLGPYTFQTSVNAWNHSANAYVVPAQQFGVFGIPSIGAVDNLEYLWVGMRYGSAPDGLKNHDYQYWWPLQFDANGVVQNMTFQDSFTLSPE